MIKKPIRILYVYKWATMGGVERVFLNRAHAFKENEVSINQDIYFLHDSGGKAFLKQYITNANLGDSLRVIDFVTFDHYDYIFSVDTPEVLDICQKKHHNKIYFECHSGYPEGRDYLKKVPPTIRGIIFPSEHFKNQVIHEVPTFLQEKIYTLQNCIPNYRKQEVKEERNMIRIQKTPIMYIGRIDELKNVTEAMDIFATLRSKYGDDYVLMIAGPNLLNKDLHKEAEKRGFFNRFIYLPALSFDKTTQLFSMIRENNGLFISSSKNESFGLSAGEALMNDVPVILSDAHLELLNNDDTFIYPLGNIEEGASKIHTILSETKQTKEKVQELKSIFASPRFIEDWNALLSK